MSKLTIQKDGLSLDGQPFYLASGSLHYFRILPEYWAGRLALMKDFGLTAVQSYVPWNLHEPHPGEFDFDGILDLARFLRLAGEAGLKVMLRPSPYICSECDFGGLPWWLLRDPHMALRCGDPAFLDAVARYYDRLCREFVPLLSTRGGPIIAVAVENEYGSYGTDQEYLCALMDMLSGRGVDVPYYTADGHGLRWLRNGSVPGGWAGVDYRIESAEAIAHLREFQPDKPPLICEYWSGCASHWGEPFRPRDIPPVARAYREALDLGGQVNFYMFGGGSNFGFFGGANANGADQYTPGSPPMYRPLVTSYDVDALLGEDGHPTAKYYACRRELDEYLGKPPRPDDPPPRRVQSLPAVTLTGCAPLFANLDALSRPVKAAAPRSMEELGQGFGFLLYTAVLRGPQDEPLQLRIDGLRDRATVYADGRYRGTYLTCQPEPELTIAVPGDSCRLDILAENMGRICYGRHLRDPKGILTGVRWGHAFVYHWEMRPLPMDDLQGLIFGREDAPSGQPAFYRGSFDAAPGLDCYVGLPGWVKGNVWINGFHLGRYWNLGPQQTLYVPGALLRERDNELIVFELHHPGPGRKAELLDRPILDGPIRPELLMNP